jgi:tRNA/rRNA methyltransferase
VLIVAYEWFKAGDATAPVALHHNTSPPAGKLHLNSFLTRLEAELDACGFLRNPEMRPSMVRNIHALFGRAELTDQELRTLHGILTELVTKRLKD